MSRINIPFEIATRRGPSDAHYPRHPHLRGYEYGTLATAKRHLREQITKQINDALFDSHNSSMKLVWCGDGTLLIVRARNGFFCYDIVGPNRRTAGWSGTDGTMEQALDAARNHAEQCFGGVLSETSA